MKVCSRCGAEKPEEAFRRYYNRPTGSYTYCKDCERIETRRKYLRRRGDANDQELLAIEQLYEARMRAGLAVPGKTRGKQSVKHLVESQLEVLK